MAYKIVVNPRASLNIADACFYYETAQSGLSHRFLSELLNAYAKLAENPQHYGFISSKKNNKLRDISIKGFPYRLIFEIQENTVTIYSVFHASRKPFRN